MQLPVEGVMERHYYVQKEDETAETSSRLEAALIAAEWEARGYDVETVMVEVSDEGIAAQDLDAA
jgi:hypothetical protein